MFCIKLHDKFKSKPYRVIFSCSNYFCLLNKIEQDNFISIQEETEEYWVKKPTRISQTNTKWNERNWKKKQKQQQKQKNYINLSNNTRYETDIMYKWMCIYRIFVRTKVISCICVFVCVCWILMCHISFFFFCFVSYRSAVLTANSTKSE